MSLSFRAVYAMVEAVPAGCVASYGLIARLLGNPSGARQVGWAMRTSPPGLPWHRIIRADGSLPPSAHPEFWRGLLENEGIRFLPDGRVDMEKHLWRGPYPESS